MSKEIPLLEKLVAAFEGLLSASHEPDYKNLPNGYDNVISSLVKELYNLNQNHYYHFDRDLIPILDELETIEPSDLDLHIAEFIRAAKDRLATLQRELDFDCQFDGGSDDNESQEDDTPTIPTSQDKRRAALQTHFKSRGGLQSGYISRFFASPIKRAPCSYHRERTSQLLRQIASQIYLYANSIPEWDDPIECQCLFVVKEEKVNLILAFNKTNKDNQASIASQLLTKMSAESLESILTRPHKPAGNRQTSAEDILRTRRHAQKLRQRIFEPTCPIDPVYADDAYDFNLLRELLRKQKIFQALDLNNPENLAAAQEPQNQVFFVTRYTSGPEGRHAERWLLDIYREQNNIDRAYMFGKKRPCVTCHNALTVTAIHHNPHHGLLFLNQGEKETGDNFLRLCDLSYQPNYVSARGNSGFDSGSDSEVEVQPRILAPSYQNDTEEEEEAATSNEDIELGVTRLSP
jgi:hypothetical protein